jgi:glycosyltransferase involved in cell wall biosynthesis
MIKLFTPSFADESDTNAQNLSVKEIVARLDPAEFSVTMLREGAVDPRIASRPNTRLLRWRKHANTLRTLGSILLDVPDIYFFPREGPLDSAFLTLRRSLRLKTAVVTLVVSGGLYHQPYAPARQRNIREATAVFANNEYLAQLLKEKMAVEARTIYDGIDRRYFFPPATRTSRHPITVLYAGSMRPYKRVPWVVHQAGRWPDVQFRIAGAGEEEQLCKALASELGCRNVEFLGHLTQPQLGDEMRRADIFFFPSEIEGHPQVLVQAAASGLPAIARKIYRPDFIVDGSTGFLAETEAELAEKLDQLIQNPELRHAMGDAAAVHAQQFDLDVIANQWQDAFRSVMKLSRRSPEARPA